MHFLDSCHFELVDCDTYFMIVPKRSNHLQMVNVASIKCEHVLPILFLLFFFRITLLKTLAELTSIHQPLTLLAASQIRIAVLR